MLPRFESNWTDPPWYASRSTQVVHAVRRMNYSNLSVSEFVHGGGWHGYDVVRLYTNIDLKALVAHLSSVVEWAWEYHTSDAGIKSSKCLKIPFMVADGGITCQICIILYMDTVGRVLMMLVLENECTMLVAVGIL